ncbi:MAG: helix-turn-helix domain-containing protein [Solirubrobacteraceae bacterium]
MTDEIEPDPVDDPWLEVTEIAEELRVNPATVRLWIRRGRLKAMRAGQRKLLVRRSELDRMLALIDPSKAPPAQPRMPEPLRPVFSRPLMGQVARARANMDPAVIGEAIKAMQEAEAVFDTAVESSDNAPPDAGFPQRIRAVAEASLERGDALSQADLIPGFRWAPVADPDPVIRSHELRPGGNRPGPPVSWKSYDMAVERLSIAVQGNVISLVAHEFREIGWVLNEIADALEQNAGAGNRGEEQPPDIDTAADAEERRP